MGSNKTQAGLMMMMEAPTFIPFYDQNRLYNQRNAWDSINYDDSRAYCFIVRHLFKFDQITVGVLRL